MFIEVDLLLYFQSRRQMMQWIIVAIESVFCYYIAHACANVHILSINRSLATEVNLKNRLQYNAKN